MESLIRVHLTSLGTRLPKLALQQLLKSPDRELDFAPHDSLPECEIDFLVDDAASERDGSYSVARHTATQLKSVKPGPPQLTIQHAGR
ncbi:hypothetical protein LA080_008925 [Diaporthe eres]|nr:hypothetical protein LA080_008925 [Diaporthe eres]